MKDRLSALLDGDLEEQAMKPVLDGLQRDSGLRREWDAYCLIGDALRGERAGSPDFVDRVMACLGDEPTVLAPQARNAAVAANRSGWRSLMPVAASVMGVAAVGLVAASLYSGQEQPAARLAAGQGAAVQSPNQVARLIAPPVQANPAPRSGEDLHREYVFAHQSVVGGGPVPAALQYVRSISNQREDAAR
ncbi:sigma-E factor negative regulatory protein [Thauera sinica]|uniref:Sigma-E factor negative regulatory protein n=1 Tax=Thauera sinica TaxID=2665146 RepID=A0ABW1AR20_9RHOO|nr:sigma-E factor negative regulatory protein [Thauera sp. K11]ATE59772.1 anti-sigma 24 factor [Thauera sp. K11]